MKLKLLSIFYSVFRNIIFWLLVPFLHYHREFNADFFILAAALVLAFGPGGYLHNFVLIPRLLIRRKYLLYGVSAAALLLATAYWAQIVIRVLNSRYPGLDYQAAANHENIYYFLFTTLLAFVLLACGKFIGDAITGQRRLEELEKQRLESELGSLRSQINPHFLFNALNTIYGMARRTDATTAMAVLKLSDILRHGIYECDQDYIPLEKEISFLTRYVEFAQLRMHDKNDIFMSVDVDEQGHECKIAPLLLIPFIENAIKHGLGRRPDSWVRVSVVLKEGALLFKCANLSYKADTTMTSPPSGGIGLRNVKRRLALLYASRHSLSVTDEGNIYNVELKIQLQ